MKTFLQWSSCILIIIASLVLVIGFNIDTVTGLFMLAVCTISMLHAAFLNLHDAGRYIVNGSNLKTNWNEPFRPTLPFVTTDYSLAQSVAEEYNDLYKEWNLDAKATVRSIHS